jgi:hypothetical protein
VFLSIVHVHLFLLFLLFWRALIFPGVSPSKTIFDRRAGRTAGGKEEEEKNKKINKKRVFLFLSHTHTHTQHTETFWGTCFE